MKAFLRGMFWANVRAVIPLLMIKSALLFVTIAVMCTLFALLRKAFGLQLISEDRLFWIFLVSVTLGLLMTLVGEITKNSVDYQDAF